MSRLEVTIKVAVNEAADKADKMGVEEIYLRSAVMKAKEVMELVGRGKFEVMVTYDRPTKTRRHSERKPKTKRSLK
jgi:hypothetical protein